MTTEEKCGDSVTTHVVIFPFTAQGHVNSMLKLAQLLSLRHVHVTFVNTEHIHHNLLRYGDVDDLLQSYPTLRFKTVPDGLPPDHTRTDLMELFHSMNSHAKPHLREILLSGEPRVTCFIADGFLGGDLNTDLPEEIGIPFIHFRTISACSFWAYFSVPNLFERKELPIRGEEDMDRVVTGVPGMENFLRCRDLPSFCRETDSNIGRVPLKTVVSETHQSLRASAIIFNTFEDLEGSTLFQIRLKFRQVFAIGPLATHLNSIRGSNTKMTPSTNYLWVADRNCMNWLDSQPSKSVIYVSFGSLTRMTKEMLMEIWYGLVNSKQLFLWVMRPDMVLGKNSADKIPVELKEGTKERGFMVDWAPQEEVLAHEAIGGFFTHSGWNSTLESLVAGVPMICWPYFADQQINSRFVSEVWKVGLDMKDVCDRHFVENMVNDLMVHRKDEFLRSAQAMAVLANKSVSPNGSSYSSLDDLIQYMKSLNKENV